MKEWKSILVTLIAGICAIISVSVAVNGFVSYRKSANSGGITVTGSTSRDFTSDLIVWRGYFSERGDTAKEVYKKIKNDTKIVKDYLLKNKVTESELIFSAVNIERQYSYLNDDNGNYLYDDYGNAIPEEIKGFELTQEFQVTSADVDKIESISRDITELIDSGVELISDYPEYYYTKLDELKLEMIEEATQNAKSRIDIMASNSNGTVGNLLNANLGVFQITAQNSDSEEDEYSYGGTFNTSSKEKTATVTVRLNYAVE